MGRTQNIFEANFILRGNPVSAAWRDLLKMLNCRKSDRGTKDYPIWRRIDGKGFTLWLSEIQLADSASKPPTWRFKLESLATLPPMGKEQWDICLGAIEKFLQDAELQYEIT
ncbi:hypothetical protein [Candidatus Nitrotoga sp. M5]|uniref:hypothetical protein n=1 Tax=Candidatus Nitrotoga sp. M5 TaxID=2890409 RepID=UPI001EF2F407|nr:hypothetical protein [Candidatus Nitrotoga sp. M5]CAH1385459.1 hypothetical protein NTGM5_120107 [Candidatus Nitrotoga sp. M5]